MALTRIGTSAYSTLDATKLAGNLPAISGASLTGIASGMNLIFDQDTSDVSEIEKTSAFSSTYDNYLLTYTNIRAGSDSGDKVLLGNSSSYLTSGQYAYGYRGVKNSSTNEFSAGGNYASIGLAFINSIQNSGTATQGMTGFCYIMNPNVSNSATYVCGQSGFRNGSNDAWSTIEYWWCTNQTDQFDRIKFGWLESTNFLTNGNYKLYGLAKT